MGEGIAFTKYVEKVPEKTHKMNIKKYTSSLLIVLFVNIPTIFACHWSGGEIWYEFNGKNYTVHQVLYTACQTCVAGPNTPGSQISIQSASLSQTLTVTPKFYSIDTLMTGCTGDTNSCNNLSSPILGYIRHHFIDTISIPHANDWILSMWSCCRNNSNLYGGAGNSIYIEATLNNSIQENTSTFVSGNLAVTTLINDTTYFPIWSNDVNGDSITFELIAPMSSLGTPLVYNPGFSVTMPLGAGSVCEFTSNCLKIFNPYVGNPSFAILVKEYRNGKLVGSRIRDMQLITQTSTVLPGKAYTTFPYIASGTNLSVTTCSGKANSIMLSFLDSTATDIVDVDVITPNLSGWTFNKIVTPGAGRASVNLSWTTPTVLSTLPQFFITLRVRDNECPNNTVDYVLAVKTDSCTADSVWPGDANSDNVVNLYDPLAVAIAYNNTGASRVNPNILWQPQTCSSWGNVFPVDNVDMKHADCNGNGTSDNADLTAIHNNYGKNHGIKKNPPVALAGTTNAILFLDTTGIVFEAGKTLQVPIVLGTASSPIDGIYGIATSINADTLTLSSPVSVSPVGSWLSTGSSTMINFSKNNKLNYIDWAQARTTHTNISGYGTIGTLTLDIPITTADNTPLKIDFENTRIIDSIGRDITRFKVKGINTTIKNKLGIRNMNKTIAQATIVPNPSGKSAKLIVRLNRDMAYRINITDIAGRVVWIQSIDNTNEILLPSQQLQGGVYFVKVTTRENESLTLKWIKE